MTVTILTNEPQQEQPEPTPNRNWVSVDEAAFFFGCSRRTLDKMIARGGLPTLRVGRVLRVDLIGAEAVLIVNGLGR